MCHPEGDCFGASMAEDKSTHGRIDADFHLLGEKKIQ